MMNQQKIYIDVDEEITTVIDRIYRVNGNDIAIIVPQHALLLQSVVNLKLLAQEAKKYNKNIILMTRDEDGIVFAQRAGIAIQPFIAKEDEGEIENSVSLIQSEKKSIPKYAQKIMTEKTHQRTNMDMGSQSFFVDDNAQGASIAGIHKLQKSNDVIKRGYGFSGHEQGSYINSVKQTEKKQDVHNENNMQQYVSKKQVIKNDVVPHKYQQERQVRYQTQGQNEEVAHLDEYEQSLRKAQLSNRVTNSIHSQQRKTLQQIEKSQKLRKLKKHDKVAFSSTTGTVVKSFIFFGIALIIFILLVILLPKTKISAEAKHIKIDEKMELTAQTDQGVYDAERRLLPARLIERDVTFTKTFNATGSGDVSAQKAQGKITIFNEYSDKQQPLVATTRFLAQDGTLFRLVNQIVVPGMTDGKPGKIEALVIADKPGAKGNLGPTKFSIPGFEGGPKKNKFYAVSEKAMTGGGTGGVGVAVVTETDIKKAQEEMASESNQYVMEQITGLLRPDNEVLIDKNVMQKVINSEANVSAGTMAKQFMYEMVVHVKALVFSEDDVLAIMESNLVKKYHQYDSNKVNVEMRYKDVVPNFEKESINMVAQGIADIVATVDVTTFKKDIIGKKHKEILKIMEDNYGDEIEKITIESVFPRFPEFIANRVSRFGFMTDIFVK